ncbi:MAG TPA: hypothetical protein DEV81_04025 [Cyanobacteria bacterium UBA11049]|nr:hypothetical protein [Cyanobacteria bacterium UBA11049]
MAIIWWGDNVSQQNISNARHKIGVSRKKKTQGYHERDELKRQAILEQLKTKSSGEIIYVDEAGIDNRSGVSLWR